MNIFIEFIAACILLYYTSKLYTQSFYLQYQLPFYAPLISLTRVLAYIFFIYVLLRLLWIPFIIILILVIASNGLFFKRSYQMYKRKNIYNEPY